MKQKIEINGTELELAFHEDGYDNAEELINEYVSDQDIDDLISDDDTREWADCEYDEYVDVDVCGICININAFDLIEEEREWSAVKEANEDSIKYKISEHISEEVCEHLDCTEPYSFTYYECSITVYPKEEDGEKTPIPTVFDIRLPSYDRMLADGNIRVTVTDDPSTTDTGALEKALLMVGVERVFDPCNGNIPLVATDTWECAYNYAHDFASTVLADIVSGIRTYYAEVEREEISLTWDKHINLLPNGEQMVANVTPVFEDAQEGE